MEALLCVWSLGCGHTPHVRYSQQLRSCRHTLSNCLVQHVYDKVIMGVLGNMYSTLMYGKVGAEHKGMFLTSSKHLLALFYSFGYNTVGKMFRNVIKKPPSGVS